MSYIEASLGRDERVLYSARIHRAAFLVPMACLVTSMVLILVLAVYLFQPGVTNASSSLGLFLFSIVTLLVSSVLASSWVGFKGIIAFMTTELGLTNKRIVGKWGLWSQTTLEQRIETVESIVVEQSVFGRMFGYGDVVVSGSGLTASPAAFIANPQSYRGAVMNLIEDREEKR